MAKAKRLQRQKRSLASTPKLKLKKNAKVKKYDPDKRLRNESLVAKAIWECLKENDVEGVIEILQGHIEALSKYEISRRSKLSRSTIYQVLRSKNPTLKTLAKIVHSTSE